MLVLCLRKGQEIAVRNSDSKYCLIAIVREGEVMERTIWIVSAKRTPLGSFQGQLKSLSAPQLGQHAITGVLDEISLSPEVIEEVFMGCVLPAGCGQAPARQAAISAGLPYSTGCTTINKVCGSGMKSVMLAHDLIKAGSIQAAIAGGMESMTNAPY